MPTEQEIKKHIKQEYIESARNPLHFFKKFCYIQHPTRGRILFNTYPFQDQTFKLLTRDQNSIILKSRQMGISTLVAAYILWLMNFHQDKNILCVATTQNTAKNLVQKVIFMYENLPSWLKVDYDENNKLGLTLKNGSKVKAVSSSSDSARSEGVSLLVMDEFAFIDNARDIWTAALPTLSTGGKSIILSTPNATGNLFHEIWVKAEQGENGFLPIKLPWDLHPERDQNWRKKQDEELGDPRKAAQECDCVFNASGDTVFYGEFMDFYEQNFMKEPLEKRGIDRNLWIWENADYTKQYIISADVARGDGKDYSTAQVLDVEANKQVAEYRGKLGTKEFAHLLTALATEYNEAILVVENANIGWSVVQTIQDIGYSNLYYTPKQTGNWDDTAYYDRYASKDGMTPGFTTSLRTRPIMIGKYQEYFNDRSVIIQSKRLIDEMKVFVWKDGRAEAATGYNDDLVMAFAIAMYIRDTALMNRQKGIDITKQMLNNINVNRTNYQGGYFASGNDNPYSMSTQWGDENFKWLL